MFAIKKGVFVFWGVVTNRKKQAHVFPPKEEVQDLKQKEWERVCLIPQFCCSQSELHLHSRLLLRSEAFCSHNIHQNHHNMV